jgi:Capsule polysaccharide biosynthesis protein
MPNLDLLAIETFAFTPHLETSAEICLEKNSHGNSVGFAFLHVYNPDDNVTGTSRHSKIRKLRSILTKKGILWAREPYVSPVTWFHASYLSRVLERNLKNLEQLKQWHYKGAHLGLGLASSLIDKSGNSFPEVRSHMSLIKAYLLGSILVYEKTCKLLTSYKPRQILLFNGRFALSRPVVEAAKQAGIKILFHERGANQGKYFLGNYVPHDFEGHRQAIIRLWHNRTTDAAEVADSFFSNRRSGDGIGWLSFTKHQIRGKLPPCNTKRRVVFFTSTDTEIEALGDSAKQQPFKSQRELVLWLINYAASTDAIELIIRLHPNFSSGDSEPDRIWWESLEGRNVQVVNASSTVDSYALADSANLVIVYGSTIGIESTYLGKPVINFGQSLYRGLGCTYEPACLADAQRLIDSENLATLPRSSCLPFGYYMMMFGEPYKYYRPHNLFEGVLLDKSLA